MNTTPGASTGWFACCVPRTEAGAIGAVYLLVNESRERIGGNLSGCPWMIPASTAEARGAVRFRDMEPGSRSHPMGRVEETARILLLLIDTDISESERSLRLSVWPISGALR